MMAGKVDEAKGRTKRAAGEVTGNQNLKNRGSVDKAAAGIKRRVQKTAQKTKRGMRRSA